MRQPRPILLGPHATKERVDNQVACVFPSDTRWLTEAAGSRPGRMHKDLPDDQRRADGDDRRDDPLAAVNRFAAADQSRPEGTYTGAAVPSAARLSPHGLDVGTASASMLFCLEVRFAVMRL